MERNRPKIMIADDHTLVAEACKKLLEAEYDVVATVGDGRALVRVASTLKPQLIVIDVAMPLLNGLDAGQQLKQMLPSVKLVYLTMSQDADMAAEAFRRGASAYLLKTPWTFSSVKERFWSRKATGSRNASEKSCSYWPRESP